MIPVNSRLAEWTVISKWNKKNTAGKWTIVTNYVHQNSDARTFLLKIRFRNLPVNGILTAAGMIN